METREYMISLIKLHIHGAKYLKCLSRYNINFELWYQNTLNTLENVYGTESKELLLFKGIRFSPKAVFKDDLELCRQVYITGLEESVKVLRDCINMMSTEGTSFNMLSDVQEYLKYTSLAAKEMAAIKSELTEANDFFDNRNKYEQPWKWETKTSKVVKILNQLINLNSVVKGSK